MCAFAHRSTDYCISIWWEVYHKLHELLNCVHVHTFRWNSYILIGGCNISFSFLYLALNIYHVFSHAIHTIHIQIMGVSVRSARMCVRAPLDIFVASGLPTLCNRDLHMTVAPPSVNRIHIIIQASCFISPINGLQEHNTYNKYDNT
jgi:hypothetical protein